jgi:hypothetical protein
MSTRLTPELSPWQIPESAILRSSGHRQFEIPGFRMFVTPFLHRIKIPELCTFADSRLLRFQASENREFPAPEKHVSRTLLNSTFRGWRVFLNSQQTNYCYSLSVFVWLVADGWCWFILREKYCWLIAGDWFVVRKKYRWLVVDNHNE